MIRPLAYRLTLAALKVTGVEPVLKALEQYYASRRLTFDRILPTFKGPRFPAGANVIIDAAYILLGDNGNAVEPVLHALYRHGMTHEEVYAPLRDVLDERQRVPASEDADG